VSDEIKRMAFVFGDVTMTFSPDDIEAIIKGWKRKNPSKKVADMPPTEFADLCMERLKASARPTRTVLHN
jgi:hypothetical protein